uniref:Uncharacterized protein n=1 Tax=Arion vulgaris TaxID=1028688 RepID=A0A0B6YSJ4_9EUPU
MMYQTVYITMLVVLACILVPGSCDDEHSVATRTIDCTRYVFAPKCRGVSAKRNAIKITNTDESIPASDNFEESVSRSVLSSIRNQDSGSWRSSKNLQNLLNQEILSREQENAELQEQIDENNLFLSKVLIKRNARRL